MRRVAVKLLAALLLLEGATAMAFRTLDPVKAFVYGEYPLGGDYFINGKQDTLIFCCMLHDEKGQLTGVALSEISIWGNRTGPWDIFQKESNGFAYAETRHLADTPCLESCRTRDYLASGQCNWHRGWPTSQPATKFYGGVCEHVFRTDQD